MELIVIQSYDSDIEANLTLGKLKEAGIVCFLQNEYTATILSNAIGNIKLVVPEDQVEQAKELLRQFDEEKKS
ncbi:MAG: DUF2007 domain-containing protein [Chitinophagaceae bacterium]|nr:DUF2007 domain-containing protein [Chitinophagaceae bacterium]